METIFDIISIGILLFFAYALISAYRENAKEKKEEAKERQQLLEQERKYKELDKKRYADFKADYQEKKEKYLSKVESDKVAFNKHLVLIRSVFEKLDKADKDFLADIINKSHAQRREYDYVLNVGILFAEFEYQQEKIESWIMDLRRLANITAVYLEDEGFRYMPIDGAFDVHQTIKLVIDKQLYLTVQFRY